MKRIVYQFVHAGEIKPGEICCIDNEVGEEYLIGCVASLNNGHIDPDKFWWGTIDDYPYVPKNHGAIRRIEIEVKSDLKKRTLKIIKRKKCFTKTEKYRRLLEKIKAFVVEDSELWNDYKYGNRDYIQIPGSFLEEVFNRFEEIKNSKPSPCNRRYY